MLLLVSELRKLTLAVFVLDEHPPIPRISGFGIPVILLKVMLIFWLEMLAFWLEMLAFWFEMLACHRWFCQGLNVYTAVCATSALLQGVSTQRCASVPRKVLQVQSYHMRMSGFG